MKSDFRYRVWNVFSWIISVDTLNMHPWAFLCGPDYLIIER